MKILRRIYGFHSIHSTELISMSVRVLDVLMIVGYLSLEGQRINSLRR